MAQEKTPPQDLVLDLASFQLRRAGQPVKLEKNPLELLILLVRRRGALVTREEIVAAIWGDAVHIEVDAGINTAIRKIRQALEDNPATPRFLETVVGKGYRFIGPITAVGDDALATPASPGPRVRPGWGMWAVLGGLGLATLLLIAMSPIRRDILPGVSGGGPERVVIAVAALQNLSQDPGQDYLVDGLTDEILIQLGELNPQRLGVVRYGPLAAGSRGGSVTDRDPGSGAQYRLEGSVRRVHDEARISVRLVRVADQTTLWGNTFDRRVGDVLLLQSEIAQRIGGELQIEVLGRTRRDAARPEVVEAYLRGRFELNRPDLLEAARAYFERAAALDPTYAPAYAGLADFYRRRAIREDAGSEQAWQLAEQYAIRAMSLDPESAEPHVAIAQIKLMHDWDWQAARQHARRALQLNPSSPEAHTVYARYLRTAGNIAEALSQRKQAAALDPFRLDLQVQLDLEYFLAGDYQNAVALARQQLAVDPNSRFAHGALCVNLGRLRLFEESIAECVKDLALDEHSDWVAAYLRQYRRSGYEAASLFIARQYLNEMLKLPQPDLWNLANAYVLAGMREEALSTLFRGLPTHEPGLLQIRVDPDFDSLRNDPRYAELVRGIGFPSELD